MEFRVRVGEREAESAFPGSGQAGDIARTTIDGEVARIYSGEQFPPICEGARGKRSAIGLLT